MISECCFSFAVCHQITFYIDSMYLIPQWHGLNHFDAIVHMSSTDGSKNEGICYLLPLILNKLQKICILACYVCNTHRTS